MINGEVKKTGVVVDSETLEELIGEEFNVIVDKVEFEDGVVLIGVTTESDGISDENTTYFVDKVKAKEYAEKLV